MARRLKLVLVAVFAITGFSALTLQVVWQRVISLHAGVDLFSVATVVSAFLAGLGLGSLAGGVLADRLGPRRSLLAFAVSNAGIGAFAWFSVWLFYDVYRSFVPVLGGTLAAFAFNFALLIVPTTLMGLSLPLVARGLVDRIQEAAPMVGRLYSTNTLGAGIGAGVSGWFLLGNLGFVGTVRLASALNLTAALLVLTLWRAAGRAAPVPVPPDGVEAAAPANHGRSWPWFVVYGLTGAVALGLEIVFFRVVDALMRSNSYTFGHLLALYLLLFGSGAAVSSRLVRRAARPERWFLTLQFAVGVAALAGVLVLVELPSRIGVYGPFERHFAIDGYNVGGYRFDSLQELARVSFVHLLGPLLIMGAPVFAMGMSFPFVQALVTDRFDTLGRRTGMLVFSNIVGNVAGTLVVGFVLLDRLGTSGTLRVLAGVLLLPGLAAAAMAARRHHQVALAVGAVVVLGLTTAAFPSNTRLWAYLHSAGPGSEFAVVEDRACVNALKDVKGEDLLFINATSQNGHPFDDFHVLIGLLPALLHPAPERAVAVGLGIGATPYGMSRDPRVGRLDVVEICGGQVGLQRVLSRRGAVESQRLLAEGRVDIHVGDGRKFLLGADDPFDLVTVDVVRPQSAFSGSLYSVEFYELIRSRLEPDGLMSQWIPTPRALNSVTEVFPHVMGFAVASYNGSQFFVASRSPLTFDRDAVMARFRNLASGAFTPDQTRSIEEFLSTIEPAQVLNGRPPAPVAEGGLNRDLMPRDEYFLNNPLTVPGRASP